MNNKPLEIVQLLAKYPGLMSSNMLEQAVGLNEATLRKKIAIARRWLRGGMIVRGKRGGYELTSDPKVIRKAAVQLAVEFDYVTTEGP